MKEAKDVEARDQRIFNSSGNVNFPLRRRGVFFSLFLFSLFLSGLVLIDRFIPPKKEACTVNSWKVILEGNEYSEWPDFFPVTEDLIFKVQVGDFRIVLKTKDARSLSAGDSVTLVKTRIFGSVLYLKKNDNKIFPQFNLFGWFLLIPGTIFLLSFLGLFGRVGEAAYQTMAVLTILFLAAFFFLRLLYN